MKDYYQILGVTPDSEEAEIRRSYRRLAMQYHPDRNPDNPEMEEKFKEVAEAYGVLTDPVKKSTYDSMRASGGTRNGAAGAGGLRYSQEEILRDLFHDPRFRQLFHGLLREFQKSGFRANSHFIRRSFFGGKGGLVFGGLFLFGTLVAPKVLGSAGRRLPVRKSLLRNVGSAFTALLKGGGTGDRAAARTEAPAGGPNDVTYVTPLSSEELKMGKVIQVVGYGDGEEEMLRVTIPPGSRNGQKLRLRGRGRAGSDGRGDLYLQLKEQ